MKSEAKKYLVLGICISALLHIIATTLGVITLQKLQRQEASLPKNDRKIFIPKFKKKERAKLASRTYGSQLFFYGDRKEKVIKKTGTKSLKNEIQRQTNMNSENDEHPSRSHKQSSIKPLTHIETAVKIPSKKHAPDILGNKDLTMHEAKQDQLAGHIKKKKFSLADLRKDFLQNLQHGNDSFSLKSSNKTTNEEGLKRLSYLRQIGEIYRSIAKSYIEQVFTTKELNASESIIMLNIERSGKISTYTLLQSCGSKTLDLQHIKIVEALQFPPIPKYLEAPLQIPCFIPWGQSNYQTKIRFSQIPKLQL